MRATTAQGDTISFLTIVMFTKKLHNREKGQELKKMTMALPVPSPTDKASWKNPDSFVGPSRYYLRFGGSLSYTSATQEVEIFTAAVQCMFVLLLVNLC